MTPFTLLYDSNLLFLSVYFPFLFGGIAVGLGIFFCFIVVTQFFYLLASYHIIFFPVFLSLSVSLLLPSVTKAP